MRSKHLLITLALGVSLSMALFWVLGAQVSSAVAAPEAEHVQVSNAPDAEIHVCPSGCPYDSIQEAVDAVSDGDVIKVAAGTYTGVTYREGLTQVVYISKTLTIQGGYTASNWVTPNPEVNLTTLDAQGQGRVLYVKWRYTPAPAIAGLHITGGNAIGQGSNQNGGGVYCSGGGELTLTNNHIFGNTAQAGGGVYMDNGYNATLSGNTIVSNTAEEKGGGIVSFNNSNLIFTENVITANTADQGGGLVVQYGSVLLNGNTFSANTAHAGGGGVFLFYSTAELSANVIVSNTAERGGGLAIFNGGDSSLVNTLVADNQASLEGTGIYISGASIHLWHTTLARNSGGDGSGVAIGNWNPWSESGPSTVTLTNTILVSQSVGMNVTDGSTAMVNSILWYNTPITVSQVPEADVSVENQITGDPAFLDPDNGDYHIGAASAAHDAGIEAGVTIDIDSQVRPMGFGYDLGVDEFGEAALSLVKGPSLVGVNVGGEVTYSIMVTSSGTQNVTGLVLTDTLDALQRVTLVESPLGNCTIADAGWGGAVVCAPGTLNVGDSITIALTAELSAAAPLGQAMTNTLVASANETMNHTQQVIVYAQDCHVRIGDEATEYTSVQAAVDAAYPTALVKVAGICMGVSERAGVLQQVYLLEESLTIQGGYTTTNWTTPDPEANPTTLDARGQGRVFYITGATVPVIDGLYITGGNANGQGGPMGGVGGGVFWWGGGFTLTNNHIFGNTSACGGGMYTGYAGGDIIGNTFTDNSTSGSGGGIALHAGGSGLSHITENVFDSNSAKEGGGLWVDNSGAQINRNTFVANTARVGGGLFLYLGGPVNPDGSVATMSLLNENLIVSNTAERGGGLAIIDDGSGSATLTNTVIADNQASVEGAGVYINMAPYVYLLHTTLARNVGGDGSGVAIGNWNPWSDTGSSTVIMTNTILAFQAVGIRVTDGSTVTVNSVLWYADPITVSQSVSATVVVQDQHTGDPAFLDPDNGDYHIGEDSAARDAGVDSGVTTDIDGQTRPMGLGWDLGADEFLEYRVYLPLVLRR